MDDIADQLEGRREGKDLPGFRYDGTRRKTRKTRWIRIQ